MLSTAPLASRAGHDGVVSCDADADRTHNLPQIGPPILSGSPCWPGRLALSGRPTAPRCFKEDIAGTTIRIVAEQLVEQGLGSLLLGE